jgi:hypothetical protein
MEVFDTFEVLQVIKLVLNRSVPSFHIAVVAPGSHRNPFMSAAKSLNDFLLAITTSILLKAPHELRAVVGLKREPFHINAKAAQMAA